MDPKKKEGFPLQKRIFPSAIIQAFTAVWLMPSPFWAGIEGWFVFTNVSGQLLSHIFKGQEVQEKEKLSWASVSKYQLTLPNNPDNEGVGYY